VRQLLAIAAVLDRALREDAAEIGGMDHQTLRDWVTHLSPRNAWSWCPCAIKMDVPRGYFFGKFRFIQL
jgi:hypothetical protein